MQRAVRTTLAVALLASACGRDGLEPPAARPNVLLISIDTLRPDHLGCYGYSKPTSPHLDDFRDDSVLYAQAIAHAPSTLHSHASILSSLLPHHHRASWAAKTRLPEAVVSLTEVLQASGYRTIAFAGGGQMDRIFGLDQGFDDYVQPDVETFSGTVGHAREWLAERDAAPFFMFLHTYEPHHPYDPEPADMAVFESDYDGPLPAEIGVDLLREINRGDLEIDDADLAHIVAAYDAEIHSMDRGFGALVDTLREMDLYDQTMIVFTSDHGEEFGEHGRIGWHSHSLHDELLRVPLLVKYPGQAWAGTEIDRQVRSIDIPTTILAAAGVPTPADFLGADLRALSGGDRPEEPLVAVSRLDRRPGRGVSSLRTERWKLYPPWLYDLSDDPAEQWDAATSHRREFGELTRQLDAAVDAREPLDAPQVAPTRKNLEELKALGYL